jgi:signal transduction histidine kinase
VRSGRLFAPFRRIGAQVALLTFFSMAVTGGIVALVAANVRDDIAARADVRASVGGFLTMVRLLDHAEPADRARMVEVARQSFPMLDLRLDGGEPVSVARPRGELLDFVARELGGGLRVVEIAERPAPEGGPLVIRVAAVIAPGVHVLSWIPDVPQPPALLSIAGVALYFGLTLLLVVPWAAWRVARPLTRFARAAAEFGLDSEHEPLPETGPDEIRTAARAFNAMRRRIADLVADRTRMLAAVGHDLRTPITRLRLRVEFVEDAELRSAMLKNVDSMGRMVEDALAFLRDGGPATAAEPVDLSALVQTVADEFAEVGADVAAAVVPPRVMVRGRLDSLKRALGNLVENALRYGGHAELGVRVVGREVVIEVADDGPGIAAEHQTEMLAPFVRGDSARAGDAGLGLGLSIAAGVVAAHGGALTFDRAADGRFLVRMTLPLA